MKLRQWLKGRWAAISINLSRIDQIASRLPDPLVLFAILAGITVILSEIAAQFNLSAVNPADQSTVTAVSLLSGEGIRRMVSEAVQNFVEFPALGVVLVAMLGVGVAEASGLLTASLRQLVLMTPAQLISPMVVLVGILSSVAVDVGYVALIPLGALVFLAFERHPIAGLTATFAGVSGGFGANLLITPLDPFFSGFSESAAQLIEPGYTVAATANYYFMVASTLLLTVMGGWVTDYIVEPMLPTYRAKSSLSESVTLTAVQRRGLRWAGWSLLILVSLILMLLLPPGGILRDPVQETIVPSPLLEGIVLVVAIAFFIPGIVYGRVTGTMRTSKEIAEGMAQAMRSMGYFIALSFVAAQFTAYLQWSNLGTILSIRGAETLQTSQVTGLPLLLLFIGLTVGLNLFVSSAAKWAILAPIFVPMLMVSGLSPAAAQAAFRIGDSATNIVTPTMSYLPIIIGFAQRYDPQINIGRLIGWMLPYAIAFLLSWAGLFIVWYLLGLPLGPGAFIQM